MKTRLLIAKDYAVMAGIVALFLGCIASSHRSAKTLDKGQGSIGASYLMAQNMEDTDADPIHLAAIDYRGGIARGFDFGIMHTWDINKDNDNLYSTFWGDCKVQLTNRNNEIGKPVISLGLMKGYVYHEKSKHHITTVPILFSIPLNAYVTPTLIYRHELIGKKFVPETTQNPRRTFALAVEFSLIDKSSKLWVPKIGLSVGTFNSLIGGDGDQGLIFNIGFSVDTPMRTQQ